MKNQTSSPRTKLASLAAMFTLARKRIGMRIVPALGIALAWAATSQAAPVTFSFEGVINSTNSSSPFGSSLGWRFHGSYTFDDGATDGYADPNEGLYSVTSFTVESAQNQFSAFSGTSGGITVFHQSPDMYTFSARGGGGSGSQKQLIDIYLTGNSLFSNGSLPLVPPSLSGLQGNDVSIESNGMMMDGTLTSFVLGVAGSTGSTGSPSSGSTGSGLNSSLLDTNILSRASQSTADAINAKVNSLDTSLLDTAVSTRASQGSVDAMQSALSSRASQTSVDVINAKTGTLALESTAQAIKTQLGTLNISNLNAPVDSRASAASVSALQTVLVANEQKAEAFRDLNLRVQIENDLSAGPNSGRVATFYLPSAVGGQLDFTRDIVADNIQLHVAAGLGVGKAQAEFKKGNDAYAKNQWRTAYSQYGKAYLELINNNQENH